MEDTTKAGSLADRFKGKVKELAGSLLGNEDLEREGRLHQAKADAEDVAAERASDAAAETERARLLQAEQDLIVEGRQIAAEELAADRDERLEEKRRDEEQRVERADAARRAQADLGEAQLAAAIDRDEDRAVAEKLQADREAADAERRADQARAAASQIASIAGTDDPA